MQIDRKEQLAGGVKLCRIWEKAAGGQLRPPYASALVLLLVGVLLAVFVGVLVGILIGVLVGILILAHGALASFPAVVQP